MPKRKGGSYVHASEDDTNPERVAHTRPEVTDLLEGRLISLFASSDLSTDDKPTVAYLKADFPDVTAAIRDHAWSVYLQTLPSNQAGEV